jgi:hypothetical protein
LRGGGAQIGIVFDQGDVAGGFGHRFSLPAPG